MNRAAMTAPGMPRRTFLADVGMGFTGLALGAMLAPRRRRSRRRDRGWTPPDGQPHFAPRAKSVIWLFMIGGVSHMESFDPKPALEPVRRQDDRRDAVQATARLAAPEGEPPRAGRGPAQRPATKLYPLQVGYRKRGQSGIEVSDWWPHVGDCIDDLAVVRSMWTTDNNHGAQLQFHTGRHVLEGQFPTIGSWVHYGLGSLNDNLPQFVVLGTPHRRLLRRHGRPRRQLSRPRARRRAARRRSRTTRCRSPRPGPTSSARSSRASSTCSAELNRLAARRVSRRPGAAGPDQVVRAGLPHADGRARGRSASTTRPSRTQRLYGLDHDATRPFGQHVPGRPPAGRARRAVRADLPRQQRRRRRLGRPRRPAGRTTPPAAPRSTSRSPACSKDLKQRGLLDETLVVWATEFGRTPGAQGGDGRDHHPYGFSVWLAGGGIKGGIVHGATDELGFHAVENRHYVTDIHATVLHQLGLDPRRLEVPGRKRLEIDFGQPITQIIA